MDRLTILRILCPLLVLLLTACGGGGSGGSETSGDASPQEFTGVFIDGPVEGLRFDTASQSGLTNSNGEFTYIAGETVTFSIGGIVLGSALATSSLTPFDLFDMDPPSTEGELRAELSNYDNVTDFHRVANMAMLLVSLDNDGDPDNGLDLSGWDVTLAKASLSFDAKLFDFDHEFFDVFTSEYDVNKDVIITEPLVYLYESLGIEILVSALSTKTVDDNHDGVVESVESRSYAAGLLLEVANDKDDDGIADYQYISTYDSAGYRISSHRRNDDDDDGTADRITAEYHTYDESGNTLTYLSERDTDGDGIVDTSGFNIYEYDDNNNPLSGLSEGDADNDGVVDSNVSINYIYDDVGNKLNFLTEADTNADGLVDVIIRQYYKYDDLGNELQNVKEVDSNGDGVVNSSAVYRYSYDDNGNQTSYFLETDIGDDGVVDSSAGSVYTYDDTGNILSRVREADDDGDGIADRTSMSIHSYDENGNELDNIYAFDDDADGVIDRNFTSVYTYDSRGNILTYIYERDTDADGVVDAKNSETCTYDDNNNKLTCLYERDDILADGLVDEIRFTEYSYTMLSDGLKYLIYDYREFPLRPSFLYSLL